MSAPSPLSGKPSDARYRPFCSRRCADLDLQRWLTGRYAIPSTDDEAEDDGEARLPDPDEDE